MHAPLLSLVLAIPLLGALVLPTRPMRPADGIAMPAAACSVSEVGRYRLLVEGDKELYVEPEAFVGGEREVLLAGWPSFLWHRVDGEPRLVDRDRLFGVLIAGEGPPRLIRSPLRARDIGAIRAVERPAGGWDIVFAEIAPFPDSVMPPPPDSIIRLWHGVLQDTTWASLDQIPLPAEAGLGSGGRVSRLIRYGDTLALALTVGMPGRRTDVLILSQRGAEWSHEIVRTRNAAYAEPGHEPGVGLALAVVRSDTSRRHDANSLFVYTRAEGWGYARRIAPGAEAPNFHPVTQRLNGRIALSWFALVDGETRREVRTLADVLRPTAPMVVDSNSASLIAPQQIVLRNGVMAWASPHNSPNGRELRFLVSSGGPPRTVSAIPYPYQGSTRAAPLGPYDLLTAGVLWDRETAPPVTMLVRTRFRGCR